MFFLQFDQPYTICCMGTSKWNPHDQTFFQGAVDGSGYETMMPCALRQDTDAWWSHTKNAELK